MPGALHIVVVGLPASFPNPFIPSIHMQVQRLKLDTEAAMLELDQILRANELSISLVAAVPALLLSGSLLRGLWVLLSPSTPDPHREALPCR
jgi:nuclear-control-of-ATPase protein 2